MSFRSPFDQPCENPRKAMKNWAYNAKPKANSTRAQIELYTTYEYGDVSRKPEVTLYHHSDGNPEFMQPKLERFLKTAYAYMKARGYGYWWDAERVGAVMIMLSAEDYKEPHLPYSTKRDDRYDSKKGFDSPYRPDSGIPVFQPACQLHGDLDYIYKVVLSKTEGDYTIKVRKGRG